MQLLLYAILIFLVSAVGGIFMAHRILNGQLAPWLVSLVHLLLGATGLVLVLLAVMAGEGVFVSGGLADVQDEVYQLWLIGDDGAVSAGLFGGGAATLAVAGDLSGVAAGAQRCGCREETQYLAVGR